VAGPLLRSRHAGTPMWSIFGIALACLFLAAGPLLAGCGGGSSDTDTTAAAAVGEAMSTTVETSIMNESELGDAVVALWAEATQKLVTLLDSKPEVDAVGAQVKQLKEEYVQKLVELGRQREALDLVAQTRMNARTVAGLEGSADADWYTTYMTIYDHYAGGDQDFANLLASFNILTQYADFELLKEQAPEEAARLGIQ